MIDYVLVATDTMRVEHFRLESGDQWVPTVHRKPSDRVPLRSLEVESTLAQIYRRVVFPGQ